MGSRGIYAPPAPRGTNVPSVAERDEQTKSDSKPQKFDPNADGVRLDPSDPSFLEAGKETGVWFKIPQEIYDKVHAEYGDDPQALDGALEKLAAIQATMDEINETLRRPDLSDLEKRRFLTKFMANQDVGDYHDPEDIKEDSDKAAAFGTLVAKLYDPDEMFDVVLDTNDGWADDGVELEEIHKIQSMFQDQMIDWMEKNDIDLEVDKTWQEFAQASLMAEEIAERRKGMTPRELLEDVQKVRAERADAIKETMREYA
jgi:hypothetical protein